MLITARDVKPTIWESNVNTSRQFGPAVYDTFLDGAENDPVISNDLDRDGVSVPPQPVLIVAPDGYTASTVEILRLRQELQVERTQHATARQQSENLTVALMTNRRIGAAVGIIMATQRLTLDAAFEVLSDASQRTNRKLRDIADDVIDTGMLDGRP